MIIFTYSNYQSFSFSSISIVDLWISSFHPRYRRSFQVLIMLLGHCNLFFLLKDIKFKTF